MLIHAAVIFVPRASDLSVYIFFLHNEGDFTVATRGCQSTWVNNILGEKYLWLGIYIALFQDTISQLCWVKFTFFPPICFYSLVFGA